MKKEQKNRKHFTTLILLVCLLAGCICTGCSGREEAKQKDEAALDSTQPVTLIYGYITADPVTDLDNEIKKQIAKFNRSQEQYILEIKNMEMPIMQKVWLL